jgi:hypothetical protein
MGALQRKIKCLELRMDADKAEWGHHVTALQAQVKTPEFLMVAMAGGFTAGFLLGHRRYRGWVQRKAAVMPGLFLGVYQQVKRLLPLIVG